MKKFLFVVITILALIVGGMLIGWVASLLFDGGAMLIFAFLAGMLWGAIVSLKALDYYLWVF